VTLALELDEVFDVPPAPPTPDEPDALDELDGAPPPLELLVTLLAALETVQLLDPEEDEACAVALEGRPVDPAAQLTAPTTPSPSGNTRDARIGSTVADRSKPRRRDDVTRRVSFTARFQAREGVGARCATIAS